MFGKDEHAKPKPRSANIARMNTPPVETEADVRVRQLSVLQALATRMSRGDQLLPADLMARVTEELELRIDEEAVCAAWAEQGSRLPSPWRGEVARASRRARGRDVREVSTLDRAEKDIQKLDATSREEMALEIDALAFDPLPRGSAALHRRKDDHMQLRVGKRRLLYKVQPYSVVIVAITSDEEPFQQPVELSATHPESSVEIAHNPSLPP
jgi:mRNA-degrading endonuclease RelE of RelBE toxin-antitoxin system